MLSVMRRCGKCNESVRRLTSTVSNFIEHKIKSESTIKIIVNIEAASHVCSEPAAANVLRA